MEQLKAFDGGSGNGWGGLIGFFSEDELCEWRLLEANYRAGC